METQQDLGKIDVLILADYVLKHYGPMSHLKLQKLLFYCQAYHLAYFQIPLVDEHFQAWVHGPVCKRVFDAQKDVSILYSDITFDPSFNADPDPHFMSSLNSLQKELVLDVLKQLSIWTGMELESSTHAEKPWIAARIGYSRAEKCEEIISNQMMEEFYAKEMGFA